MREGGCFRGAVRFRVEGPLPAPAACHCDQCRRRSGHFAASTAAPLTIIGEVRGYGWKPGVRSGSCPACGAQPFRERTAEPEVSVEMGAFDEPAGLRLAEHIFTAEKGDRYDIADGLPSAPDDRGVFA